MRIGPQKTFVLKILRCRHVRRISVLHFQSNKTALKINRRACDLNLKSASLTSSKSLFGDVHRSSSLRHDSLTLGCAPSATTAAACSGMVLHTHLTLLLSLLPSQAHTGLCEAWRSFATCGSTSSPGAAEPSIPGSPQRHPQACRLLQ